MVDQNMTTSTDNPAAGVTQADRDAAAEYWLTRPSDDDFIVDEHEHLLQAFARHRQQSIAQHEGGRGEPFGYWVEQKYAEPLLLRKPAYIPEPSERCSVTPLYAAPPALEEMGCGDVIALVNDADWRLPEAPQLAYANGWNAAIRAVRTADETHCACGRQIDFSNMVPLETLICDCGRGHVMQHEGAPADETVKRSCHNPPATDRPAALVEGDDLLQRILGRARFCRERGEIKTPGLFEDAHARITQQAEEVARLKAEVQRLDLSGLHTCHDKCDRLPCVQQREIARLREALAYMLRVYDVESDSVDTFLTVPEGASVFSVASARAALNEQPGGEG